MRVMKRVALAGALLLASCKSSSENRNPAEGAAPAVAVATPSVALPAPGRPEGEIPIAPALAESTRASETGATPEVLPEARPVSSSLALLGQVPAAPSSEQGPTVALGSPQVSGGLLGDVDPAILRMRAAIRACYARFVAVEDDVPDASSLSLRIVVAPNGSVRSVVADKVSGLAPGTTDCIVRRAQVATFPPPATGGPAEVVIPITAHP